MLFLLFCFVLFFSIFIPHGTGIGFILCFFLCNMLIEVTTVFFLKPVDCFQLVIILFTSTILQSWPVFFRHFTNLDSWLVNITCLIGFDFCGIMPISWLFVFCLISMFNQWEDQVICEFEKIFYFVLHIDLNLIPCHFLYSELNQSIQYSFLQYS